MQQYQDLKFNPFKIRNCTTCFGLLGHHKVRGNCCAFHATAIRGFVFTLFLNEVDVVSPSMSHVLSFWGCSVTHAFLCTWRQLLCKPKSSLLFLLRLAETKDASPCSIQPATWYYPEPTRSTPHSHILNLHFNITFPSMLRSTDQNSVCISQLPYMSP
jgi:hypothetical protein